MWPLLSMAIALGLPNCVHRVMKAGVFGDLTADCRGQRHTFAGDRIELDAVRSLKVATLPRNPARPIA
jgi:hypothetical protein